MSTAREAILARCRNRKEWPVKPVETPEWGRKDVYVRKIGANEIGALDKLMPDRAPDEPEVDAMQALETFTDWTIFFASDDKGEPLFVAEDKAVLLDGPSEPLKSVGQAGLDFNGFGGISLEEQEKNSPMTPSDASPLS